MWVARAVGAGFEGVVCIDFAEDGAQRTEGEAIWEQSVRDQMSSSIQGRRTLGGMSVETMVATSNSSVLAAMGCNMALMRRLPQSACQAPGCTPAGPSRC
jgi:hypothetical protein